MSGLEITKLKGGGAILCVLLICLNNWAYRIFVFVRIPPVFVFLLCFQFHALHPPQSPYLQVRAYIPSRNNCRTCNLSNITFYNQRSQTITLTMSNPFVRNYNTLFVNFLRPRRHAHLRAVAYNMEGSLYTC